MIEERQLRAIGAAAALAEAHPEAFREWQRLNRPITHLSFVRAILDLDSAPRPTSKLDTMPLPTITRPPAKPAPRAMTGTGPLPVPAATEVRLGETTTMRKDPVLLPLDQLKTHVAFLGASGSGKTTAALSVVEQLLERGISTLLVDRKGDLARYASEAWWQDSDRRRALRDRIDIALFTPGNAAGPALAPAGDPDARRRLDPGARSARDVRGRAASPR